MSQHTSKTNMHSAIVMHSVGGPEVLKLEQMELPALQPREVRIRHTSIGVNFHDAYVRSGLYNTLALPGIPGIEAAGVIDAVGDQIHDFQLGDRVAYVTRQYGAYSEQRNIDADLVIPLPDYISDNVAAASLLKGLTAHMLLQKVYTVQPGDTILVHAAAGGVGSILCQWATHLGAVVIGTVGSEQKIPAATAAGCKSVLLTNTPDLVSQVLALTDGEGVQVAYDAIGKDTFFRSLDCLAPCGHLANYGQSSGPVPAFEVSRLFAKSNSLSRPSIFKHIRTKELLRQSASAFFKAYSEGVLDIKDSLIFPLADAESAHRELENRQRSQTIILTP